MAPVESPVDRDADRPSQALRKANLTFSQENRPQERDLGIIYVSVAPELMQGNGVPWRYPTCRWLMDSYPFGGAAKNYNVRLYLKE